MICTCTHTQEEHGNDEDFPGSTACDFMEDLDDDGDDVGCGCVAFDEDENEEVG